MGKESKLQEILKKKSGVKKDFAQLFGGIQYPVKRAANFKGCEKLKGKERERLKVKEKE